jgi:hypothetical protein
MSLMIPSGSIGEELARASALQHPGWRLDQQYPQNTVAVESPHDISSQYGLGFFDSDGRPPTKYDVLLGRGKFVQHHKGNIRLHSIINGFISRYIHGDKRSKTQVSADILKLIRNNGERSGRFLKFNSRTKSWVDVNDSIARQKVGHAIRDSLRAPVLREMKTRKRITTRVNNTKRNLEKMAEDRVVQEYAEKSIRGDLSGEDFDSLKHRHAIELHLPAARTDEEISISSGSGSGSTDNDNYKNSISSGNADKDKNFININDTRRCPVIPVGTRGTAEDASSLPMRKETWQTPAPMMYPLCGSTRNVVGHIVNLQDVPPEILAGSRSFVTFLTKMHEESDEEE